MAYIDDVKQLYQQQLGREADAGGLEYFTQQMNNGWSVNDVVNAMQNSAEAQSRPAATPSYEPAPSYTPPAQTAPTQQQQPSFDLNSLYKDLLGREADASGMSYWQQQIAGGADQNAVRNAIMNSAEYKARNPAAPLKPSSPYQVPNTGEWIDPNRIRDGVLAHMSQPGYQLNFADLMTLVDNSMNHKQEAYADYVDVPGLGVVHVSRSNAWDQWGNAIDNWGGSKTGVSGIQLHNKEADEREEGYKGRGWGWGLSPGSDGSIQKDRYDYSSTGIPAGLLAVIAAPFVVSGIQGLMGAASGGAAEAGAGWISAEGGAGYLGGLAADASELAAAAGGAGALEVSDLGLDQYLSEAATEGLDVSGLGLDQYLGDAALEGGLDVSNLGLDQFTDGWPDLETLGTTADGGLAYPGMPGYIPPSGSLDTSNYSNEGRNYPTPVSTSNSPVNATTGPGAAPTIPLTPGGAPTVPATPNVPRVPGAPTTPTRPTTGNNGNLGTLLGLLYGAYSKNRMADQLKTHLDSITNMYKPGSPEAELMRQKIEARDAAAGRRSQYGRRETELAGMLAGERMRALTSPGFMTMQAAMMNNDPGMGGLSELLAALSGGNVGGLNLPFDLNDIMNTGLIDGDGWLSNLFN